MGHFAAYCFLRYVYTNIKRLYAKTISLGCRYFTFQVVLLPDTAIGTIVGCLAEFKGKDKFPHFEVRANNLQVIRVTFSISTVPRLSILLQPHPPQDVFNTKCPPSPPKSATCNT